MIGVSFIIPCFNYATHITSAVESVFPVMREEDELIVIDDGSTDDTGERLKSYVDKGQLQYFYQDNAGVSAARNQGARLAKNEYLYFLDADDRILEQGFNKLRQAATRQPEKAMIFGGHSTIEGEQRRFHRQLDIHSDRQQNFLDYVIRRRFSIANGGAVLVKRDVALRYAYPEDLKVSEDFCVYAWILANEPVGSIPDEIVEIMKHPGSLRNQLVGYAGVVERLPDILFNSSYIPQGLMRFRQRFYCNRLLSLFRMYYLAGQDRQAKSAYTRAIRCRWMNLFKLSYLRKYLRIVTK